MTWIYLLFLPLATSARDIIVKWATVRNVRVGSTAKVFGFYGGAVPWLFLYVSLTVGFDNISRTAVICSIIGGLSIAIGWRLTVLAIEIDDMSIVLPIQNLVVVMLIIVGIVFFNVLFPDFGIREVVYPVTLVGIAVMMMGTCLMLSNGQQLYKRRGVWYMLVSICILCVYCVATKIGVHYMAREQYILFAAMSAGFWLLLYAIVREREMFREIPRNIPYLLVLGLFTSIVIYCEAQAFLLIPFMSVVSGVKKGSTVISTVTGIILFNEGNGGKGIANKINNNRKRLLIAGIIFLGAFICGLGPYL